MVKEKPVHVVFKGETLERLEELRKSYGASTKSELIRNGVRLLAALENLKEKDGTITIAKGGKYYKLVMP